MIYTFGNSHANMFTDSHPATNGLTKDKDGFISCSLGATIAYNFYEHHLPKILQILEDMKISKEHDYIMLIVGEVDCRWHLPLQSVIQNRNVYEVVYECIERFFRNYILLQSLGYKLIGWGGHPSTTEGHSEDMNSPIFGDCATRNSISLLWNELMKNKCLQYNIPYVSIIEDLIDENKLTKMDYFIDYCHLDYSKVKNLLSEKMNKIGINI